MADLGRTSGMKITVDGSLCQGHTLCAMTAPQLFRLNDEDGHSQPVSEDVPAGLEEVAREAARSCPEQAITALELSPTPPTE